MGRTAEYNQYGLRSCGSFVPQRRARSIFQRRSCSAIQRRRLAARSRISLPIRPTSVLVWLGSRRFSSRSTMPRFHHTTTCTLR